MHVLAEVGARLAREAVRRAARVVRGVRAGGCVAVVGGRHARASVGGRARRAGGRAPGVRLSARGRSPIVARVIDVVVAPGRDRALRRRHPWVLSGAVAHVEGSAAPGAFVRVRAAEGDVLGYGHY
ncbi:MAG: hypothetical protein KC560_15085, partial [Myxococcales bacterium]|nr:hypothetical protein [Myxococcales bacterium]